MRNYLFWIIGLGLIVVNVLLFLFRKNGFDYKDYVSKQELYPSTPSDQLPTDTSARSITFTADQLRGARRLLQDSAQIDTCKTDLEKLLCIDHFLYRKICLDPPIGTSTKAYPNPVSYFEALQTEKELLFQCGHAAYVQAFFCAAVDLKIRGIQHIQRPGAKSKPDSHVYNEVWLGELGQWVISDFYQNRHIIKDRDHYWTAIDLYEHARQGDSIRTTIALTDSGKIIFQEKSLQDPYFSNDYYLIFYKEADSATVYSWKNKIRHYLMGYSHFKTFDPGTPNTNYLYWLRNTLLLASLIWLSIFIWRIINGRR